MGKRKVAGTALNTRHRQAATLLAEGFGIGEVARQTGCSEEAVLGWLRDPAVMALYREKVDGCKVVSYARAVRRIAGQMEDENPMVVLRAAKEALEKFESAAQGADGGLIVRVEGMPALGMPSMDEEAEE